MRKVAVVVTARPSYSRIRTALDAIQAHPDLELQLVVGASALLDRYGDAAQQIRADGFDIAATVYMVLEGENPTAMAKTTGLGLLELATVFDNLRPDVVLTVADRYETLATATAAAYMNIPLAHVQGGEVSGSIDEKVRHAVTKLSDLHFVCTERASQFVINMGEARDRVFLTGCPSIDLAREVSSEGPLAFDPYDRYGGVGPKPPLDDGYLVVMQHPVTTEYAAADRHAKETIEAIERLQLPTMWFWPNVDAGSDATSKALRRYREDVGSKHVHFFRNMAPKDFLSLLHASGCLIGNSSVGIRECSYLGVPVVNIGTRQTGRERGGNVVDVAYESAAIEGAVQQQLAAGRFASDHTYGTGDAGVRIADLLATAELTTSKRLTYVD